MSEPLRVISGHIMLSPQLYEQTRRDEELFEEILRDPEKLAAWEERFDRAEREREDEEAAMRSCHEDHEALWHAIHELKEHQMTTQADVDQLVQQISQVETDLGQASSTLQAEIDQLAAQNPTLDLSSLQAAVQPLDAQVQALGALKPTSPPAA